MFPLSFWNFGKWNSFGRDGELLLLLYVHIFFFSPLLGEVLAPVFGGVCVCVCVCVCGERGSSIEMFIYNPSCAKHLYSLGAS